MIYTFRTRCDLIKHLRALCELSGSIEHSVYPMKDFEIDLPYLIDSCALLKRSSSNKIYIAFRICGFESTMSASAFKIRLSAFQSVIACYIITFVDGLYVLQQISLD